MTHKLFLIYTAIFLSTSTLAFADTYAQQHPDACSDTQSDAGIKACCKYALTDTNLDQSSQLVAQCKTVLSTGVDSTAYKGDIIMAAFDAAVSIPCDIDCAYPNPIAAAGCNWGQIGDSIGDLLVTILMEGQGVLTDQTLESFAGIVAAVAGNAGGAIGAVGGAAGLGLGVYGGVQQIKSGH